MIGKNKANVFRSKVVGLALSWPANKLKNFLKL